MKGFKVALDEHGLPLLAKAAFSRNTHAVHASLFSLAKADLYVILIVGTYTTNADIINLAKSLGHDYIMANLSFVLFTVAGQTFRLADFATVSGTVSAMTFMLGGLSSIVLLTLFF